MVCSKTDASHDAVPEESPTTEGPARCVLIIGSTGNGKSTLVNLLKGEDVCDVGHGAASKTTGHQEVGINIEGAVYNLIDTIGIGDTSLSSEAVLYQLAHAISACRHGIVQVRSQASYSCGS